MNLIKEYSGGNLFIETAADSILGTRKYQQDFGCLAVEADQVFAAVCDGMGGMEGGEKASQTATECLMKAYRQYQKGTDIPGFFRSTATQMDKAVAALKDNSGKPLQAGTTAVVVWVRGSKMYWVSVGDSKIYLIRNKTITGLNPEHNYKLMLDEQLASGQITKQYYDQQIATSRADALTSYMGMNGLWRIDGNKNPIQLEDEDIIVLCSDGLYKCMTDSQIQAMVKDNDIDMGIAAERTLAMSRQLAGRSQDNTTVVLMKYQRSGVAGRVVVDESLQTESRPTQSIPAARVR